jgi:hypothetical protein
MAMDTKEEVRRIEELYGISFGLDTVIAPGPVLSYLIFGAGMYVELPFLKNTVFVNSNLKDQQFKEALYHELGHALLAEHGIKVPRNFNGCRDHKDGYWAYLRRGSRLAGTPRHKSFCSGYARTNREEDFCETFACYLINQKTKGWMRYENARFMVTVGTKLHRKFLYVEEVLKEVRNV